MPVPSSVTPFVDDDEKNDDESLYAVTPANDGPDGARRFGPDGDGAASSDTGSNMPEYAPRNSGATDPENNSPAMSDGKASGVDPLAGSLYAAPPSAPQYKAPDSSQYEHDFAQLNQDATPLDRKNYKPTLGQHIRAGVLGALEGAIGRSQAPADNVLNGRYDQAESDRKQRESADVESLAHDRNVMDDQRKDAEMQQRLYGYNLEGYKANQSALGDQWTRTHDLTKDKQSQQNFTTTEKRLTDEDTERGKRETANSAETSRHNRADEGARGREISVSEKRLRDEEDNTASGGRGRPGSPTNQRLVAQDASKYQNARQSAFDRLNHGDPRAADESGQLGYQGTLKRLQGPNNPETNEPWQPGEQDDAIKRLQQQHLDDLNRVETDYVDNMHGLGYRDTQPVKFNDKGEALTDSAGKPVQRQMLGQRPAGAGGQPQQQQQQQPPQQQQRPQTFRTRGGQSVTVGQAVTVNGRTMHVTGFNQQTGKVQVGP